MLILSRKVGEELVIGANIRVTVTRIAGNRVTLGIEADPSIKVMRGELIKEDGSDGTGNESGGSSEAA